jgi:hypothetical protein
VLFFHRQKDAGCLPITTKKADHVLSPLGLFVWLVADGWCWFVLREKYRRLVADGWFVLREK